MQTHVGYKGVVLFHVQNLFLPQLTWKKNPFFCKAYCKLFFTYVLWTSSAGLLKMFFGDLIFIALALQCHCYHIRVRNKSELRYMTLNLRSVWNSYYSSVPKAWNWRFIIRLQSILQPCRISGSCNGDWRLLAFGMC